MKYKIFTKDKIVNLFSIFVLGTILFLLWLLMFLKGIFEWKSIIMMVLFSIGSFFYLIILYSIIVYYFSRWGFWLFNRIDKNRDTFVFGLEILIAILSIIGTALLFKSFWVAVISIPSTILIIAAMPPASDWIKRWYNLRGKKKVKSINKEVLGRR